MLFGREPFAVWSHAVGLLLALIFFGNLWMITVAATVVAELAVYEFLQLASIGAKLHGASLRIPAWWMAIATAALFLVSVPNFPVDAQLPVLSFLTLVLFGWNGFRSPLHHPPDFGRHGGIALYCGSLRAIALHYRTSSCHSS